MRRHRGNGAGPFPGSLEQPQIWPILWISTLLLSDHNLAARRARGVVYEAAASAGGGGAAARRRIAAQTTAAIWLLLALSLIHI